MKGKVKIDFPLLSIKFLTDDFEPEKINVYFQLCQLLGRWGCIRFTLALALVERFLKAKQNV